MKRVCWLLILLPLLAACAGPGDNGGGSSAACAGPYIDDQPSGSRPEAPPLTIRPGATVDLYGHGYTSTCNDTGGDDPLEPLPDVQLTLTLPGGQVERLGRYSPTSPEMGFKVAVRIPADSQTGSATISDDRPQPATFRFLISDD